MLCAKAISSSSTSSSPTMINADEDKRKTHNGQHIRKGSSSSSSNPSSTSSLLKKMRSSSSSPIYNDGTTTSSSSRTSKKRKPKSSSPCHHDDIIHSQEQQEQQESPPTDTDRIIYTGNVSQIKLVPRSLYSHLLPPSSSLQSSSPTIAMKILNTLFPTSDDISRFYNEYELLKNISFPHHPSVIRPILGRSKINNRHVIFMEWINGKTIKQILDRRKGEPLALKTFFKWALMITRAVVVVHEEGIIHKDLNGRNIIVRDDNDEEESSVTIIDFELSCRYQQHDKTAVSIPPTEQRQLPPPPSSSKQRPPRRIEGSLPYIPPEQTGLLPSSIIDYRSDLYSLGTLFYSFLAGRLPFQHVTDPLMLIQAQLATVPPSLRGFNSVVPTVVERLILKLLEKEMGRRYQSARGLEYDLMLLKELYDKGGESMLENFILGQNDYFVCNDGSKEWLMMRRALHGKRYGQCCRDDAFESIRQSMERTMKSRCKEMVLISGESGSGKTLLVEDVLRLRHEKDAVVVGMGKYDDPSVTTNGLLYGGIRHAFDDVLRQLLLSKETRTLIRRDVGYDGMKILSSVFPRMARELVQWQSEIRSHGSSTTAATLMRRQEGNSRKRQCSDDDDDNDLQNRFFFFFCQFVKVLTSVEKKLLVFLDDWQWMDEASSQLITVLMKDESIKGLLLIGAYRSNSSDSSNDGENVRGQPMEEEEEDSCKDSGHHESTTDHHQSILHDTISTLCNIPSLSVTQLTISNLTITDIHHLLSDALTTTTSSHHQHPPIEPLATLIYSKTNGNAFYVMHFLRNLTVSSHLQLVQQHNNNSPTSQEWTWNINDIASQHVTDNVASILESSFQRLDSQMKHILQMASCFGNVIDYHSLCLVLDDDEDNTSNNNHYTRETTRRMLSMASSHYRILLLPHSSSNPDYRFSHDKIRSTIYHSLTPHQRRHYHNRIAKLLYRKLLQKRKKTEKLNFIVTQMNMSLSLQKDDDDDDVMATMDRGERYLWSRLNLHAAERAYRSGLWDEAHRCLAFGFQLLINDDDDDDFVTTRRQLHLLAARIAYIQSRFDHMMELLTIIFNGSSSSSPSSRIVDNVEGYTILMKAYRSMNNYNSIIDTGLKALTGLGEIIPDCSSSSNSSILLTRERFCFVTDLIKTKYLLWSTSDDTLLSLPYMTNPQKLAAMRLLHEMMSTSFMTRPSLTPHLIFRTIQLTLKYGLCLCSLSGLVWYAGKLCSLGYVREGYRYGMLVRRLLKTRWRDDDEEEKDSGEQMMSGGGGGEEGQRRQWITQVSICFYGAIDHHINPVSQSLSPLRDAYEIGLRVGEMGRGMVCASRYCAHLYFGDSGGGQQKSRLTSCPTTITTLRDVACETRGYLEMMMRAKQENVCCQTRPLLQAVINFMGDDDSGGGTSTAPLSRAEDELMTMCYDCHGGGEGVQTTRDPTVLTGEVFDEDVIDTWDPKTNLLEYSLARFHQMVLAYYFHDYWKAKDRADDCRLFSKEGMGFYEPTIHPFYDGLIALALTRLTKSDNTLKKTATTALHRLSRMAHDNPSNYANKYELLLAENDANNNSSGDDTTALSHYERAITLSERYGFLMEEALCCERAGMFCIETGRVTEAGPFFMRSRQLYLHWGAMAKVKHIESLYGNYIVLSERDNTGGGILTKKNMMKKKGKKLKVG